LAVFMRVNDCECLTNVSSSEPSNPPRIHQSALQISCGGGRGNGPSMCGSVWRTRSQVRPRTVANEHLSEPVPKFCTNIERSGPRITTRHHWTPEAAWALRKMPHVRKGSSLNPYFFLSRSQTPPTRVSGTRIAIPIGRGLVVSFMFAPDTSGSSRRITIEWHRVPRTSPVAAEPYYQRRRCLSRSQRTLTPGVGALPRVNERSHCPSGLTSRQSRVNPVNSGRARFALCATPEICDSADDCGFVVRWRSTGLLCMRREAADGLRLRCCR